MKTLRTTLFLGIVINLCGQSINLESINFNDQSIFVQKVLRKSNDQIDFVEYIQKSGNLKKIEFYNSEQRIRKSQIWNAELIEETDFTYFEKGQIIKRYDVLNQAELSPKVDVYIMYPAMARENKIEGIVEIALTYNEYCVPTSYKMLNKLGYGIDEEVARKMKLLIQLSQKHKVPSEECHKTHDNFKVNFKLE